MSREEFAERKPKRDEDIEDLRRRVALRRQAAERNALKSELYGRDKPIDDNAVYLSIHSVADLVGLCTKTILKDIANGTLQAAKVFGGRRIKRWAIHPDDAKSYLELRKQPVFQEEP